jgi:hypothetical protein
MERFRDYDCNKCSETQKIERGCEADCLNAWIDNDGNKRYRCPRRPILENPRYFSKVVAAFNNYKNGFLPVAGGINDQPALFSKTIAIIEDTISQCEEFNKIQEKLIKKPKAGTVSLLRKE